jgi:hypothetical protein
LQFPEPPPFATDLLAVAIRTNQKFGADLQHKPDTAVLIQCLHVIVALSNPKRMIQQALTHAPCYKTLIPDTNFPEEPENPPYGILEGVEETE